MRNRIPVIPRKRATPAMMGLKRLIVSKNPPGDTFWSIVVVVPGAGEGEAVTETAGAVAVGVAVTWITVGSGDGRVVVWTVV
jgi:hypothetical protein